RSSEKQSRRGDPLELGAGVAEADDHGAGAGLTQRLEEHVDALVVEELSEVENGRLVGCEPGGEPIGVAFVGKTLLRVARVRRGRPRVRHPPAARPRAWAAPRT